MRSSKVKYISTSKTEAFTMVTSHPLLRKMSNFVMRRGPTCINDPCVDPSLLYFVQNFAKADIHVDVIFSTICFHFHS